MLSEVFCSFHVIKKSLDEINSKNFQNEYLDIVKKSFLIEKLKKRLTNQTFLDLKELNNTICEASISEKLKSDSRKEKESLDIELSEINSSIFETQEKNNKYMHIWQEYKDASQAFTAFVYEQNSLLSIFSSHVPNDEYLNYNITVLEEISQHIKNNRAILEQVNVTASKLKEHVNVDRRCAIDKCLQSSNMQLSGLEKTVKGLLVEQTSLQAELIEFYKLHHLITDWISQRQREVQCFQTNRLKSLELYEVMAKESNTNHQLLLTLRALYNLMERSSLLNSVTKDAMKSQLNHVHVAFKSLQSMIAGYKNNLLESHKEFKNHKQILVTAENFVIDVEKIIDTDVPFSKNELETAIKSIVGSLEQITSHYAAVQHIKRKLLLGDIVYFDYANSITKVNQALQVGTSVLISRYLKLYKAYSESNSIPENIEHVVEFIKAHRKFLDEMPYSYSELLRFSIQYQVTSVYMQGHRYLIQCVIKEGLRRCKALDPSHLEGFVKSVKAIQREWDALDSSYEVKMYEVKSQLYLWEKYLHQFQKVKIWTAKVENKLKWHSRVPKPSEIKTEVHKLQELIAEQENILVTMEGAKTTAGDLCVKLDCNTKGYLNQELESLQASLEQQGNLLKYHLRKLEDLLKFTENYESNSATAKACLNSSMGTCYTNPNIYKDINTKLQETQVALEKLKETSALLDEQQEHLSKVSDDLFCSNYDTEISTQKQIAVVLSTRLSQMLIWLSGDIHKKHFEEMLVTLSVWGATMSEKVKKHYYDPPETVFQIMENPIKHDIIEKQALLEKVTSTSREFIGNFENIDVSEEISNVQSAFGTISSLHNLREQNLIRILTQKERVTLLREKLKKILKNGEDYFNRPIEFSEVSITEIDATIQEIETLQVEVDHQVENLTILDCTTEEMFIEPDAFVYMSDRQLFKSLSQSILHCFDLVKALSLDKHSQLADIKENWKNILSLLNDLESWLKSREKTASDVDYTSSELPRSEYLEGIKTFENLKHNFQDDVHVLHNVNSAYHKISRKDLDVKNCLQTRVLSTNDRWHILYKKVSDTITTISNVLQLWAEYEQIHQHLHLFLTETHIKITSLENSGKWNQDEWNSLMNDFGHHKVVLERYYSMANNLKERSKCSSEEIDSQVEEIRKYWLVVYESLQNYQESHLKTMSKEEEYKTESVVDLSFGDVNIEATCNKESFPDIGNRPEPDTKLAFEQEIENYCAEINVDAIDFIENTAKSTIPCDSLIEDQVTEVQEEFMKDLLAALKEAEDRIDFLENVLSEQTPSGIEEESGPNYSRLLAACRSSIDVIQHLNQLLSENIFQQRQSKYNEADIHSRTEGMLNRWEKLENATLSKELRAHENARKWQKFSDELKDIEEWLLQTLQTQSSPSTVDADIEKFIMLLQKHEILVKEINKQKKSIITLNAAGQKFTSSNKEALVDVNKKLQAVNEHWDKLCSLVIEWQNKLQNDFLQSYEFHNTISEMELWLKESEEKIKSVSLTEECSTSLLHEQHTEIFALKQQLDNCSHRVKTLLDMSALIFHELGDSEPRPTFPDDGIVEVQSKLNAILDLCHSLLLECTEKLDFLSKSLMGEKMLQEGATCIDNSDLQEEGGPTRIKKCCNYLLRVARASFPIQALLLLLLGAAILLPKEEEEITCRFANNFASSLNPMLRYPDGPPPV